MINPATQNETPTFLPPIHLPHHHIGNLAQREETYIRTHWQPWMDWLNGQFPNERFELAPLGLGEANSRAELDFLLTNQAQFFYLSRQNVRWLATLTSPFAENGEQGAIGSSIWVCADSPYQSPADLKGKTLSAVDNDAFGGFLLGNYEFFDRTFGESIARFAPLDTALFLVPSRSDFA